MTGLINELLSKQMSDKYNSRYFHALYNAFVDGGMDFKDITGFLNGIYDIASQKDLVFLEYMFAAFRTDLSIKLLYCYDGLRADDFEGWDAPVTYKYKGRNGVKRISGSGLPMPNRGAIYDSIHADRKDNPPLVTIAVSARDFLPLVRLTVESIYHNTKGIDYELYLRDCGSTNEDITGYFNRLPKKCGIFRDEPEWLRQSGQLREREEIDKMIRGRYTVNTSVGSVITHDWIDKKDTDGFMRSCCIAPIVTSGWLENMLAVVEADENVGLVSASHDDPYSFRYKGFGGNLPRSPEEVAAFADKNNKSNPSLGEEALYISSAVTLEARESEIAGKGDMFFLGLPGYKTDKAIRIRESGLRIVDAGDCYCHILGGFYEDCALPEERLSAGLEALSEKRRIYNGLVIYGGPVRCRETEMCNPSVKLLDCGSVGAAHANILTINDFACNNTVVIKNYLIRKGVAQVDAYAHVSDAEHFPALRLFCGQVSVGGAADMALSCIDKKFDVIFMHGNINELDNMYDWIKVCLSLLKPHGELLISFLNPFCADAVINRSVKAMDICYKELTDYINSCGGIIAAAVEKKDRNTQMPELLANVFGDIRLADKLAMKKCYMRVCLKEGAFKL